MSNVMDGNQQSGRGMESVYARTNIIIYINDLVTELEKKV